MRITRFFKIWAGLLLGHTAYRDDDMRQWQHVGASNGSLSNAAAETGSGDGWLFSVLSPYHTNVAARAQGHFFLLQWPQCRTSRQYRKHRAHRTVFRCWLQRSTSGCCSVDRLSDIMVSGSIRSAVKKKKRALGRNS
ncbi:Piso0_001772 [Millerozyma farinosa CBS 7064]|uniref:Piso0_001772 protein n=1 Tax=Pichia sorbitophila (strain ATCC MYA-4447 / BCRC 22081 / CBS 7064 / NBRC 10061 / NRRL Y-12695) TaxID=559304 RepID=G8YLP3_PICSO|nr:Piso0_001772 [Millerozyma farinosa CBS 7064]